MSKNLNILSNKKLYFCLLSAIVCTHSVAQDNTVSMKNNKEIVLKSNQKLSETKSNISNISNIPPNKQLDTKINMNEFDALDKQFLEPEEKKVFTDLYVAYNVPYTYRKEDKLAVLDVYYPPREILSPEYKKNGSPMIILVHGGAWISGDKAYKSVIENKVAHYTQKGYLVASINYRLLPQVSLAEQVQDVARAIGYLQKTPENTNVDLNKIVVIGHSSGAHLVALLSVNPEFRKRTTAKEWAGTVLLDNVAFNVEEVMRRPHAKYFDRAFGADSKNWSAFSPEHQLTQESIPLFIVSSTQRKNSDSDAKRFTAVANEKNISASGISVQLNHSELNEKLGLPSSYTNTVDKFIDKVINEKN